MEKFSSSVITLEESPDSQSNYRNSNNSVRTCTWADGEKYVGEYKNDKQHGTGTYTDAKYQYVGEWKDGKYHGQGTCTWANGEKYVGEYKNNKQHGTGTYTQANGDKYVGEYKNDEQHGTGTYFRADGKMRTGIWVNHKCIETLSFQSLQKTLH